MIICVANTSPEKVKAQLRSISKDFDFSVWKDGEKCAPGKLYGFYSFEDIKKSKVKTVPFFFNIVSAFNHIAVNHPILKYDFTERPTGLVLFRKPNLKKVSEALKGRFSGKELDYIVFKPARVSSKEDSELDRVWNNFSVTLPYQVAEAFMVCFLTCVKTNDVKAFHTFVVDNRLVGTGNKKAYEELDAILSTLWPVLHALASKAENADSIRRNFIKKHPQFERSLSRFLFWKKSYKGKILEKFMDDENNVSYGIRD